MAVAPLSRLLPQALCLLPQGLPETFLLYPQNQGRCALSGANGGQQRLRGNSICIWQKILCAPSVLMLWDPQSPSASSRPSHSPGILPGVTLPVSQCWEIQKEGPASRLSTLGKAHEQEQVSSVLCFWLFLCNSFSPWAAVPCSTVSVHH